MSADRPLPVQLTSFVGRARELAELRSLLPTTRLLTIAGPGGAGKTLLALHLAADLVGACAREVWLVDRSTVSTASGIAQVVAAALRLPERRGPEPIERLIEALSQSRLWLLVDNCEHLLPDIAFFVERILSSCPELGPMTTSRETLGVAGETVGRMPPLDGGGGSGSSLI